MELTIHSFLQELTINSIIRGVSHLQYAVEVEPINWIAETGEYDPTMGTCEIKSVEVRRYYARPSTALEMTLVDTLEHELLWGRKVNGIVTFDNDECLLNEIHSTRKTVKHGLFSKHGDISWLVAQFIYLNCLQYGSGMDKPVIVVHPEMIHYLDGEFPFYVSNHIPEDQIAVVDVGVVIMAMGEYTEVTDHLDHYKIGEISVAHGLTKAPKNYRITVESSVPRKVWMRAKSLWRRVWRRNAQ